VVVPVSGRTVLVLSLPGRVVGFDAASGQELWSLPGIGTHVKASPVYGEGVLVAPGGGPRANALAVKLAEAEDGQAPDRLWLRERFRNRIGSGVIHEGHFYTVSEVGIAECLDLKTGRTVWEERLRGAGARSAVWASLVRVGDRLYAPAQSGDVFVLRASPTFEVLAVNSVGNETIHGSLAIADGGIFIRTSQHLWCIEE
jgi:outer membrane protein assembly factor BamB